MSSMNWQHSATWLLVAFAACLLLRKLPWPGIRRTSGCNSCHGCSGGAASKPPGQLVQLGASSGIGRQKI
ncbi:MAG UNVERIFIED_CONTAM: hypothetical protein LVR18_29580 [Planctomycetaceae bacterium]